MKSNLKQSPTDIDDGDRTGTLNERGAAGWGLLWLLGVPIPVLLVFFLLRGCT